MTDHRGIATKGTKVFSRTSFSRAERQSPPRSPKSGREHQLGGKKSGVRRGRENGTRENEGEDGRGRQDRAKLEARDTGSKTNVHWPDAIGNRKERYKPIQASAERWKFRRGILPLGKENRAGGGASGLPPSLLSQSRLQKRKRRKIRTTASAPSEARPKQATINPDSRGQISSSGSTVCVQETGGKKAENRRGGRHHAF